MKPYIIFFKGAVHHRSDPIFTQAQALSGSFEGEYWTYGSTKIEETIGTFQLHCLKVRDEGGIGQIFSYAPRVVAAFLRRRREFRERDTVVVSYDPFIHGLIAALVAWLIGAKLVVEMPGAYENSDRFPNGWKRWLAIARQKIMAQVAVWRADAVRFIFDNQITRFVSIPRSTLVTSYFDAANIDRFGQEPDQEEQVVLLVGFPYYIKGCDTLIEAWRSLSARYPDWRLF
ncbi:MAG: hypothetical protein JSS20_07460, partial [Proteobacteria bacterium]|nr:hypothetical protein [Pseudomonadota bacterium]